jgi:hypothetical protein
MHFEKVFQLGLAAAVGLFGCAADCESLCKEGIEEDCCRKDCPDCDCPSVDDCEKACEQDKKMVEEGGCQGVYDAVIDCTADVENICDASYLGCSAVISNGEVTQTCKPEKGCPSQRKQLNDCIRDYCLDHLDDPACAFTPAAAGPPAWWASVDDDDEGGRSGTRWKCFDDTSFGQCDCLELGPGDEWDSSGTEVDECPTYAACVRYYDGFFESNGCSCGPTNLMPPDATDLEAVASCPP